MSDAALNQEKFEKHVYGVIYLDILGQKALMEKLESGEASLKDEAQMQNVLRHIKSFLEDLMALKNRVSPERSSDLHRIYIANNTDPAIANIQKEEINKSLKELKFGIEQFSDTTMIYIRLDGDHPFVAQILFSNLAFAMPSLLFNAFKNGILVRGAITKGHGWEIKQGCLYGPVIRDAYKLESEVAQWPRVVVSQSVVEMYRDELHNRRKFTPHDDSSIQLIETSLVKGFDGKCQIALFPLEVLKSVAEKDKDVDRPRRTLEMFCALMTQVDDEIKSKLEEIEKGKIMKEQISENAKLIYRYRIFKQEFLGGILSLLQCCREAKSLPADECEKSESLLKEFADGDISSYKPLNSIFED